MLCINETDEPESSISSTVTPHTFLFTSVTVHFTAATVMIVSICVCISVAGLAVKDACCPLQVPHCRFPDTNTNNLWQGGLVFHNTDIAGGGNPVEGGPIDCS